MSTKKILKLGERRMRKKRWIEFCQRNQCQYFSNLNIFYPTCLKTTMFSLLITVYIERGKTLYRIGGEGGIVNDVIEREQSCATSFVHLTFLCITSKFSNSLRNCHRNCPKLTDDLNILMSFPDFFNENVLLASKISLLTHTTYYSTCSLCYNKLMWVQFIFTHSSDKTALIITYRKNTCKTNGRI